MSTESERRTYTTEAQQDSAKAGETRAESGYDRTGETGHGPEIEPGAARHDAEQTASMESVDAAGGASTTEQTPVHGARESEPLRENVSAGQHAPTTERPEHLEDSGRSGVATSEQAVPAGSAIGSGVTQSAAAAEEQPVPLFAETDRDRLRTQWREVQVTFVDSPRDAVHRADELLGDIIHQLTTTYEQRKRELDERRGDTSDTEGLRQALRGYRSFFDQLLSIGG
ncbi:hypothetical protein [Nocardia sp. CY41]|uniref:hypothetical protein n=1 Tax=Nocardia sp. CY41 TaxID=2608686 RepID=UPI00135A7EA9|nr:hypothetical protein [Nocardia sp. CY41]